MARACGELTDGIIFMWGMWLGSGYSVFLWEKNSSKKFEIKIVGKKEHRWEEWSELRGCGGLEREVRFMV